MTREERIARYVAPVLRDVDDFASEGRGSRHRRFVPLARRLGGLVRDGALTHGEAAERLEAALRANGHASELGNVRRAIVRELRRGTQTDNGLPRELRGEAFEGRRRAMPERIAARPREPSEYRRLPLEEISRVWAACDPVTSHLEALATMGGKPRPGIDWSRVASLDLARVLRPGVVDGIAWAEPFGGRLLVPTYDAEGRLRSIKARAIVPRHAPKELAPRSEFCEGAGLVLACLRGAWLLARPGEAEDHVRRTGLVIVEGVPRWLAWASRFDVKSDDAPAVLGIFSGSWTEHHARRVPRGAGVLVVTDADAAGDAYAERVAASLRGRADVVRRTEVRDAR